MFNTNTYIHKYITYILQDRKLQCFNIFILILLQPKRYGNKGPSSRLAKIEFKISQKRRHRKLIDLYINEKTILTLKFPAILRENSSWTPRKLKLTHA